MWRVALATVFASGVPGTNGLAFDRQGRLRSALGCDSGYTANTLCADHVWVAHPLLEGADGITLDRAGNVWTTANERNAMVVVTNRGAVIEAFRNPPAAATGLRNAGPLEFPTRPFLPGDGRSGPAARQAVVPGPAPGRSWPAAAGGRVLSRHWWAHLGVRRRHLKRWLVPRMPAPGSR